MTNDIEKIYDAAIAMRCRPVYGELLSAHTSFRIGGPAELFLEPPDEKAAAELIRLCGELSVPVTVIGNGSNLLVGENGINGAVISTAGFTELRLEPDGETITCGAGVSLGRLAGFALENSLSGLEFAQGIPGSVGGAVFMNAGAYGGEIKDVIVSARHITPSGKCGSFTAEELKLSYRHSVYAESGFTVTGMTVHLQRDDKEKIRQRCAELAKKRRDKQPLEYPSAGSTFKRPQGYYAAALIEQCGLKGISVGGAQVSEKHAGFIINKDNATFDDVMSLISLVQKTVYEKTGVQLETEVRIIS